MQIKIIKNTNSDKFEENVNTFCLKNQVRNITFKCIYDRENKVIMYIAFIQYFRVK